MSFNLSSIFPIVTTSLSFLFFIVVLEQYRRKGKAHQFIWSIAMFLFMVTAGAEGFSIILGYWIPWVYRAYYVLAAVQVSFMGGGVLYLFDSRNVINERNSAKQFILFGFAWGLFSFLFLDRSDVFLLVLIPSLIMIGMSLLYYLIRKFDARNPGNQIYLCKFCREEMKLAEGQETNACTECGNKAVVRDYTGSSFTKFWHNHITGRFFSNFFLVFSLFIFFLMNMYAWTAPLHEGLLVTGKEVSGLPWQIDPYSDTEPRALVRLFSPLHTVPGAIALIGGGFYSYISWQFSIRNNTGSFSPSTGFFNVWIALGALVLGQGAFFSGLGYTIGTFFEFLPEAIAEIGMLYISEVISVSMMLWGFFGSDQLSKEKLLNLLTLSGFSTSQGTN